MIKTDRNDNLGYFKEWPAPMFEAMCRLNPADQISSTTPFYGPMLYTITRAIHAQNAMEIGNDLGYSSGFLAWAIKENNARYHKENNGRFYGIDISDKSSLQEAHDKIDLPSTFINDQKGSVHWLENQTILKPETLDIVFVDGLHQNEYVQREIELLYPLIKGRGMGFICMHDVYSSCRESYPLIASDGRYHFETIRFPMNYGFAILRKMDGHVESDQWPQGDETDLGVTQGVCNLDGSLK